MREILSQLGLALPKQACCKLCSVPNVQVAAHLWHLMSVKAQLVQHLHALKDYFLLARGVTSTRAGSLRYIAPPCLPAWGLEQDAQIGVIRLTQLRVGMFC